MKDAAYAELFEMMFKYALAYSDEPRSVTYKDSRGETVYEEFNRYDFLEQDADGGWHWNDQFLFSCDTSAPLASNREAMWQETRLNFQQGTFGPPQDLESLIMFWTKMAELHYPGAEDTLDYLQEMLQQQQMQQQQMQQQQMMMQRAQMEQQARQNAEQNQLSRQAIMAARADAQRESRANRLADINKLREGGRPNG